MQKTRTTLRWLLALAVSVSACSQDRQENQSMSVTERLQKARSAKAVRRTDRQADLDSLNRLGGPGKILQKATTADYRLPVVKSRKGPNGEVVRIGGRGGAFYVNKNGNKTYLSSNE